MVYVGDAFYSPYLEHHGILGMKWGIRRYQNKDGTLTPLGERRLQQLQSKNDKIESKMKKIAGEKTKLPEKEPAEKKSVFKMSDDELRTEIARMKLEKEYKSYMRELHPSPEQKQKTRYVNGRKIAGEIVTHSLTTVGKSVGETLLGKGVNKLGRELGLEYDLYTRNSNQKKKKKNRGNNSSNDDDDDDD